MTANFRRLHVCPRPYAQIGLEAGDAGRTQSTYTLQFVQVTVRPMRKPIVEDRYGLDRTDARHGLKLGPGGRIEIQRSQGGSQPECQQDGADRPEDAAGRQASTQVFWITMLGNLLLWSTARSPTLTATRRAMAR